MTQYILMGIILLLMAIGMIAAYHHGKYSERKRVVQELMKAGVDFDGDTISTICLARIVFNNSSICMNRGD